jgi:predicted nuclease with TOPRIM domain
MKKTTFFAIALGVGMTASTAFAQYPADFTKDQADSTIAFRRSEITTLQGQVSQAKADVTKTNSDIQTRMAEANSCRDALYAMLGTDRNGYNAYRERLQRAEQELGTLRNMGANADMNRVNALENEIRYLRGEKIVLIRDHKNRVQSASNGFIQMKRGLVPQNAMYTVGTWRENRDCLWNIAKKPEIYNDAFAWPKIWRANMDQIKNPDVIHPGMQLAIVKTEVTPEDRDATGYRRARR